MTKKRLIIFCCVYCFLWSVFPLMRNCLPMDTMEAVYWGNYLEWGNYKHPPFSGFVAKFFFDIFGGADFSLYFLSQFCVAIALFYIYRLVQVIGGEQRAIQAVYLSTGILYFNILAIEFNTNVLSIPLWAVNSFYFYQAVRKNKTKHWIVLGVTAGLNLLTKYTGGVLLLGMGIYMICTSKGRQRLKQLGPYLTFISCIAVLIPHILWLFKYDFLPLRYITGRGGVNDVSFLYSHIVYPIKFIVGQFANISPILFIYLFVFFKNKSNFDLDKDDKQFIYLILIFPFFFMITMGGLFGVSLRSMWGTAMMFSAGICLILLFPIKENISFEKFSRILLSLLLVAFVLSNEVKVREKVTLNSRQFAEYLTEQWHQKYHRPLKYVGGSVFYIAPLTLYSSDHPIPIGDKLELNPWLNQSDIVKQGGIIVMKCKEKNCQKAYQHFSQKQKYSDTMSYETILETKFGKTKQNKIYYCFMPPRGENND